MNLGLSKE